MEERPYLIVLGGHRLDSSSETTFLAIPVIVNYDSHIGETLEINPEYNKGLGSRLKKELKEAGIETILNKEYHTLSPEEAIIYLKHKDLSDNVVRMPKEVLDMDIQRRNLYGPNPGSIYVQHINYQSQKRASKYDKVA